MPGVDVLLLLPTMAPGTLIGGAHGELGIGNNKESLPAYPIFDF